MLLPRHPQPGLRHEVPERQRRRQPVPVARARTPPPRPASPPAPCGPAPGDGPAAAPATARCPARRPRSPQQRRPAQVHPRPAGRQQLAHHVPAAGSQRSPPRTGSRRLPPHHLDRLGQPLPRHRRPVDVVAVDHLLQRAQEPSSRARESNPSTTGSRYTSRRSPAAIRWWKNMPSCSGASGYTSATFAAPPVNPRDNPADLPCGQLHQRQHLRRDRPRPGRDQVRRHRHLSRPRRRRQPGRRRRLEQRPHRDRHPPLPQPLHQRHRQQRVPAQLEEVILGAHRRLQPEDLGERPAQDLLRRRRRAPPARHPRRNPGPAAPPGPPSRSPSAAAHPAPPPPRHHVLRQPPAANPRTAPPSPPATSRRQPAITGTGTAAAGTT